MSTTPPYHCRVCASAAGRPAITGMRDWEHGTPGEWHYWSCDHCGVLQLHPFPTMEQLVAAYPSDYHAFEKSERKGAVFALLKKAFDRATTRSLAGNVCPGDRVLDVGCGEGVLLDKLREIGAKPSGLDFSPHAVERCRARGHEVFEGLFADYEAGEAGFDAIYMNGYLEHTLDPAGDLRKAAALLKPGGRISLRVPNLRAVDRALFGRFWGGTHAPRHTFGYTDATLPALLKDAGFGAVRVKSLPSPTYYALSVQNRLQCKAVESGKAPRFKGGRAPYYTLLLLAFAPLHLVCMPSKRVGIIEVTATKASDDGTADERRCTQMAERGQAVPA